MKSIEARPTVRPLAAILVAVAVIALSVIAMPRHTHNQNAATLKSIQTDKTTIFYADQSPDAGIWFVEAVLTASDNAPATENLEAVAATL
jgi:hypothetical protein